MKFTGGLLRVNITFLCLAGSFGTGKGNKQTKTTAKTSKQNNKQSFPQKTPPLGRGGRASVVSVTYLYRDGDVLPMEVFLPAMAFTLLIG